MEYIYEKNKKELEGIVAQHIAQEIRILLRSQKYVVLGLVGGRSVSGVYKKLARESVNWKNVHMFMVDERFVPLFSKESNARMVRDCFSEVMSESNMHFFDPKKETVKEYYKSLKEYGGRFDIVVLSAGEDDHIASLFAGHPESSRSCFIEIRDAPKPPKKRMSASRKLLLASPYAHLLFMGDKKKHALSMFFDETVHEEEAPAKLVYRMKHTFVYSDVKV